MRSVAAAVGAHRAVAPAKRLHVGVGVAFGLDLGGEGDHGDLCGHAPIVPNQAAFVKSYITSFDAFHTPVKGAGGLASATMRLLRTIAALALPVALLGACGDDDAKDASGSEDGTEVDVAADQALADDVVLRQADVGPEWTSVDPDAESDDETDADDAQLEADLADCLDVDPEQFADAEDDVEAAASFEQEQAQLDATAAVARTLGEIEEYFAVVSADGFADCYGDVLETELQRDSAADEEAEDAGVEYRDVEVSALTLPAELGDDAVGYRATIALEVEGTPVTSYQDVLFVRRGHVLMTLTVTSNFEPVPEPLTESWAAAMDERATAA